MLESHSIQSHMRLYTFLDLQEYLWQFPCFRSYRIHGNLLYHAKDGLSHDAWMILGNDEIFEFRFRGGSYRGSLFFLNAGHKLKSSISVKIVLKFFFLAGLRFC